MVESKIDGAAANAAAAANTTNPTEIAQDALLSSIKKCQELSAEVDIWINHVKENGKKGIPFLKRTAKAGARAFIALERLSSEVYQLQERWKAVNTVPENELEELPEEAPIYNLATDRLTQLITGWEKCLSKAHSCFHGYRKQDALNAAELSLGFLRRRLPGSPSASFLYQTSARCTTTIAPLYAIEGKMSIDEHI